jgi:replication-associated recombination protein RarA
MECLPDNLRGTEFYQPTERGIEQRISQRLAEIRARRKAGP